MPGSKARRHSPEQIVTLLQRADGLLTNGSDVAGVCRDIGVTEATYYRWRNLYGGLKADDAKRLKRLEMENATLKRLLAEAELEKACLKELAEGNSQPGMPPPGCDSSDRGVPRVGTVRVPGRAPVARSAYRRQPRYQTTNGPDAWLRRRLRAYAKRHPRWGYRRAYHDLRAEGTCANHKKVSGCGAKRF